MNFFDSAQKRFALKSQKKIENLTDLRKFPYTFFYHRSHDAVFIKIKYPGDHMNIFVYEKGAWSYELKYQHHVTFTGGFVGSHFNEIICGHISIGKVFHLLVFNKRFQNKRKLSLPVSLGNVFVPGSGKVKRLPKRLQIAPSAFNNHLMVIELCYQNKILNGTIAGVHEGRMKTTYVLYEINDAGLYISLRL